MDKEEKQGCKVTLLCGISASGKTRMSRAIEKEGAVRLCVDEEMWHRYGNNFITMKSEDQRRLTIEIEDYIRCRMKDLLSEGKDVVVDSCLCKRFKRDAFESAAKEMGADIRKIYLTAPRKVLIERLARRRGEDANDIIVTPDELERFLINFQPPSPEEGYEILNTGK